MKIIDGSFVGPRQEVPRIGVKESLEKCNIPMNAQIKIGQESSMPKEFEIKK